MLPASRMAEIPYPQIGSGANRDEFRIWIAGSILGGPLRLFLLWGGLFHLFRRLGGGFVYVEFRVVFPASLAHVVGLLCLFG